MAKPMPAQSLGWHYIINDIIPLHKSSAIRTAMLLFTPGPTPTPESIRQAMATPTLHHRTKEFESIFAKARLGLQTMLNMEEVLMLASSGTGAMEASVLQLCHSKLLSISCGKFGQRWGKIALANNLPHAELVKEWDTPISAQEVLEALQSDPSIDTLALQVCESAGGLRLPLEQIAREVKTYRQDIIIIADAITAMGVEPLDTTHIDVLIGGSQKAFMLPPGMSIIGLSKRALEVLEARPTHRGGLYFSFLTELKNQRKNTTAWTAPTTLISGLVRYFEIVQALASSNLDSALESSAQELDSSLLAQGFSRAYTHTRAISLATREAISALGLSLYPKSPALAMSAIAHTDSAKIRQRMKALGVNVAAGQDHIKDSIFRINHMGLIHIYEASYAINALELSLDTLGLRSFDGAGNASFFGALKKQEIL